VQAILFREFFGVFRFDKRLQVIEAARPEGSVLFQPGINGAKRLGIEIVKTVPSFSMFVYQMRTTKQAQVFRNRGSRDGKR
jgi:hypothetical protein